MAGLTNPQALLADKEAYYEKVTRNIRWIAIGIVLITFPPDHPGYKILLLFAGLGLIFNLLRYSGLMRWPFFASRVTTLIADNFLIAVLVWLSGGLSSPYFIFWVFPIISGAYWYGQIGIACVLGWETVVTLAIMRWHGPIAPADTTRTVISKIFGLIALGILAERLTQVDRNERAILTGANIEVETARQRMSALINSLADPVLAINNHQEITVYNGATLDLLNTNEGLTGHPLGHYLKLEDVKGRGVPLEAILGHPSVLKRNDLVLKQDDGSSMNLDVSVAPIHTPEAKEVGYILVLRDITKQKTLDEERDEFIAVTSHELRTPVAIAEANLSTALLPNFGQMNPKALELIKQAHQNIVFLGQLIKDLSTLSKAEQGLIKIELETIDPAALVNQLAHDYGASASARKLTLKTRVNPGIQPLTTSLNLVHEILQNFITNAIKYTERGGVTIAAEPGEAGHGIVFSVSDTGIGISASDKKKLFTKFYRSEDYRTRKTNGTGLGLYITLKLAERLGAKIWYKSRLNAGSTFFLWVPQYKEGAGPSQKLRQAVRNLVERP